MRSSCTPSAGDYLKFWMAPLMIAVAAFVLLHRRADRTVVQEATGSTAALAVAGRQRVLALGLAVVTAVLALGTAATVYRIGDLGAQATWGGRVYQEQTRSCSGNACSSPRFRVTTSSVTPRR